MEEPKTSTPSSNLKPVKATKQELLLFAAALSFS
jgi:hypothetical protein